MTTDDIKAAIRGLPQREYTALTGWLVGPERRRRQEEVGKSELVLEERKAGIRDAPAVEVPEDQADNPAAYTAWSDPGVIHDRMYGLGDRVCHQGRIWESTTPGLNHWEPGAVGVYDNVWRDVTDELTDAALTEGEATAQEPADDEPDAPEPESEPTPEPPTTPEWRAGLTLARGDQVTHGGTVYTVVQPHTAQTGWEPENVPALFTAE